MSTFAACILTLTVTLWIVIWLLCILSCDVLLTHWHGYIGPTVPRLNRAFDDRFAAAVINLSPFLDKLGMDDKEAKRFYRVFEKVDKDLEGGVSLDEYV